MLRSVLLASGLFILGSEAQDIAEHIVVRITHAAIIVIACP